MSLTIDLRVLRGRRTVVVGIGNPLRGDDAAGSLLAQQLAARWSGPVFDAEEAPERLLGAIAEEQPDVVLLVDSVYLAAEPGAVALLHSGDMEAYWPSTHRAPLSLLMDYLGARTGAEVLLLAIQPQHTALFGPPSRAVSDSVSLLVDELLLALGDDHRLVPERTSHLGTERCEC